MAKAALSRGTPDRRAGPEEDDARRRLPSIDALLRSLPARKAAKKFGRPVVKHALQLILAEVRQDAANGGGVPPEGVILARAFGAAARQSYGISEVINATGVVLHTGLGRAPLPDAAARAAARVAHGYSDLE